MKRFILLVSAFSFCTLFIFGLLLARADGYTDEFYIRFTTPQKSSMILGTSRAAQGVPCQEFKKRFGKDMFNFAFTVYHSSYSPTYLESVRKKLDPQSKDGLFILTVDPWSISSITEDPNDSLHFRELDLSLGKTKYINLKPNYFYLLNNLNGAFHKVIWTNNKNTFLHDDGWLEVNIDMDSVSVANRTKTKIASYRENSLPLFHFSSVRLRCLEQIIALLEAHGEVYLVRLPVHPEMLEIEQQLMPDFESKISDLVDNTSGYLDINKLDETFVFTDGNHLHKDSGFRTSEIIADWITNENSH